MRIAVVTGAGQGIGRQIATTLLDAGYGVATIDIRPVELAGNVLPLTGDVSDENAVVEMARQTLSHFGSVDVLVNNAGISSITPAESTTASQWTRVLAVNLTGPFLLCREFGRSMLAAGSGSIVNIASIAGLRGIGDRAAYNASKHGLVGLTRTLAAEWGGRGVRVNAVCPGWVKTEMDAADQAGGGYVDSDIIEQVPMGRFAAPADIAAAVAFLADPAMSGFINGAALPVDGGWSSDASWQSLRLTKR
jgi:NAD(P)-dependent dehydrogenase (short-subunit alcohol dehydrogenase family)